MYILFWSQVLQEDEDSDEDLDIDDEIFNSLNDELLDEDVSVLRGGQPLELEDVSFTFPYKFARESWAFELNKSSQVGHYLTMQALTIASQVIRLGGRLSSRDLSIISEAAEASGIDVIISKFSKLKLQCTRTLEEFNSSN